MLKKKKISGVKEKSVPSGNKLYPVSSRDQAQIKKALRKKFYV